MLKFDQRQTMDGVRMLGMLPDRAAAACFFDPQHRAVLDRQKYGNEGKRQRGRAALPSMTDGEIAGFVDEIGRVLRPGGHLFLWVDKFCVGERRWALWLPRATPLAMVDLAHWNKTAPGMGRRLRGYSEYLVVIQNAPQRAAGVWRDRGIPDTWPEAADRQRHAHAKPIGLIARLIRATTRPRDLVVDPAAGGWGVLDACKITNRRFCGADILG